MAPRLVCVGRLSAQKGQLLLIEAAAILRNEGLPFELVLVGDGEMRSEVEQAIARHDLGDRIRITGWANGTRVREEIAASRALVLPSFAEGLPVVIMEALALGRPVIATYVAGVPELVAPSCEMDRPSRLGQRAGRRHARSAHPPPRGSRPLGRRGNAARSRTTRRPFVGAHALALGGRSRCMTSTTSTEFVANVVLAVNVALAAIGFLLAAPCIVLFMECLAALLPSLQSRSGRLPKSGPRRVTVMVPAHDEQRAITETLVDIMAELPRGGRVLVVAAIALMTLRSSHGEQGPRSSSDMTSRDRGKASRWSSALPTWSTIPPTCSWSSTPIAK